MKNENDTNNHWGINKWGSICSILALPMAIIALYSVVSHYLFDWIVDIILIIVLTPICFCLDKFVKKNVNRGQEIVRSCLYIVFVTVVSVIFITNLLPRQYLLINDSLAILLWFYFFLFLIVVIVVHYDKTLDYLKANLNLVKANFDSVKANLNSVKDNLETITMGAKVFKLDRNNPCVIVFTHRGEIGEICKMARDEYRRQGNYCNEGLKLCEDVGKSCSYENLSPAIPKDEEEMISWIDHWARSVGASLEKYCSCEAFEDKDRKIFKRELFEDKTIIILGDIMNRCSFEFQELCLPNMTGIPYKMVEQAPGITTKSAIKFNKPYNDSSDDIYIYSGMDTPNKEDYYGLVTITKNPLSPNYDLIILAGNRKLGQRAITNWFENKNNQQKIIDEYTKKKECQNTYMQFLVKGKKVNEEEIKNITNEKFFILNALYAPEI